MTYHIPHSLLLEGYHDSGLKRYYKWVFNNSFHIIVIIRTGFSVHNMSMLQHSNQAMMYIIYTYMYIGTMVVYKSGTTTHKTMRNIARAILYTDCQRGLRNLTINASVLPRVTNCSLTTEKPTVTAVLLR